MERKISAILHVAAPYHIVRWLDAIPYTANTRDMRFEIDSHKK